jgi:hypothetical protein
MGIGILAPLGLLALRSQHPAPASPTQVRSGLALVRRTSSNYVCSVCFKTIHRRHKKHKTLLTRTAAGGRRRGELGTREGGRRTLRGAERTLMWWL